jgi:hypothetical protein
MPDPSLPLAVTPGKKPLSTDRRRLPRVRRILRDSKQIEFVLNRLATDLGREGSPSLKSLETLLPALRPVLWEIQSRARVELHENQVSARRPYNRKKPRPIPAPVPVADTPLPLDQAA